MDNDYLLAMKLQEEFDREVNYNGSDGEIEKDSKEKNQNNYEEYEDDLNSTQNLVHPEWETLDPTPDVKALFNAFDNKFFQGKLKCVELEWSKRMYSCAGICYTRKNRLGMAIIIRLSEPLLKLRTRKDLIETLLHEMIHAYCTVLRIKEDNGGHGPVFKKIMNGINKVAGTNITVYHSFHDEVNVYKTHWWRCNGICQNRSPFFGYVKRTSNRAPGPNDIWWRQHLESCGGSFLKIKEPESKRKLKGEKNKENISSKINAKQNIKTYFPILNKDDNNQSNKSKTATKTSGSNLSNVIGFKDLTGDSIKAASSSSNKNQIFGVGYSLTSTTTINSIDVNLIEKNVTTDKIRYVWSKKYPQSSSSSSSSNLNETNKIDATIINTDGTMKSKSTEENYENEPKKRRIDSESNKEDEEENLWTVVDDDDEIMIKENTCSVIDISSDEDTSNDNVAEINDDAKKVPVSVPPIKNVDLIKQKSEDRQREIKQEILDTLDLTDENDIELIDDEFNDELNTDTDIVADTSLVDDLFGEDTLLKDFNIENSIVSTGTKYHRNSNKDVVVCPICEGRVIREDFSDHLDGCSGITVRIKISPGVSSQKLTKKRTTNNIDRKENSNQMQSNLYGASSTSEGINRRRGLNNATHSCPVCAQEVDVDRMNEHLDLCLEN